jgi:alpha-N-arabinofuranosidase
VGLRRQHAADDAAGITRRYATFVKAPYGVKIQKVASGANGPDTNWTEVMMREAGGRSTASACIITPCRAEGSGSATDFTETDYARTMAKTWKMEELADQTFRDHGQV